MRDFEERLGLAETGVKVHTVQLGSGAKRIHELGQVRRWMIGVVLSTFCAACGGAWYAFEVAQGVRRQTTAIEQVGGVQQVQAKQGAQIDALDREQDRQGKVIDRLDDKLDVVIQGLPKPRKGNK